MTAYAWTFGDGATSTSSHSEPCVSGRRHVPGHVDGHRQPRATGSKNSTVTVNAAAALYASDAFYVVLSPPAGACGQRWPVDDRQQRREPTRSTAARAGSTWLPPAPARPASSTSVRVQHRCRRRRQPTARLPPVVASTSRSSGDESSTPGTIGRRSICSVNGQVGRSCCAVATPWTESVIKPESTVTGLVYACC